MTSSHVEVFRHPDELPPDVQRMFAEHERVNVEFGLDWYRNLVAAVYPDRAGVRFFVLRRGGSPVAVIPVVLDTTGRSQRVRALGNYYTSLYAPVVEAGLAARDLKPLIEAIRDADGGSSSLTFAPMDPQSESFATMCESLRLVGLRPFRFFCFANRFLECAGMGWPQYLASRTSGLRSTIKRMSKKFAANGGTLDIVTGMERVQDGVNAFQQVYAASWKQSEPYPDFVPGLIDMCARRGWLRLGIASLDGRAVAAQLWIVAGGRAEIYKVAYDEGFKQYSPGTLVTAYLMQHAIENDHVSEVDYLIGDDDYKRIWMSDRRERWGVVAYNPATLAGLLGLVREAAGRAAKPWLARGRALWQRRAGASAPAGQAAPPAASERGTRPSPSRESPSRADAEGEGGT